MRALVIPLIAGALYFFLPSTPVLNFPTPTSAASNQSNADFCAKAIEVECNATLFEETTVGAGSALGAADYEACEDILRSSNPFNGPDKIYRLQLNTATTLTLNLEIFTANVDLDLFVFNECEGGEIGPCVVAYGTSDSRSTGRESVTQLLQAGIYYIVVDGPTSNFASGFNLEILCENGGSNDFCEKAIPVNCNSTLTNQTTVNAGNALTVSDYNACSTIIPSGNPFSAGDKIYRITLNTQTNLNLNLDILNPGVDLDLFIFNDCEGGRCVLEAGISDSRSTGQEVLAKSLEAGTYYIVVDGPRASSQAAFNLQIECDNTNADFCDKAIPVDCNTTLTNQTTVGAGNALVTADYNACRAVLASNNPFTGPERIYQLQLQTATNIELDLEILSTGIDLDLFVFNTCEGGEVGPCVVAAGTSDSRSTGRETLQQLLQPGIYYIVVDGSFANFQSAFNLQIDCGGTSNPVTCSCVERDTNFSADLIACDNFESYALTELSTISTIDRWKKSDDAGALDGTVVTAEGGKKLRIRRTNGNNATHILYDLQNLSSGRYRLSWRMYVAEAAYYRVDHAAGTNAAYRVFFNANGQGEIKLGGQEAVAQQFSYQNGAWNEVMQIIDIEKNEAELWINDEFVHSWAFNTASQAPSKVLGGIVFQAVPAITSSNVGNYEFLIDDICVWQKTNCPLINVDTSSPPDTFCLKNGVVYTDYSDGLVSWRCDLYTPDELGVCPSVDNTDVCDLGGSFIYRGDEFNGTLSANELVPNLVREAGCVELFYDGLTPDKLYGDIYIFYNTEAGKPININVNSTRERALAVVFRCECGPIVDGPVYYVTDGDTLNRCQQICLDYGPTVEITNTTVGFYYVLIMSDVQEDYSFSIFPNGPCEAEAIPVACDVVTNGLTSGGLNDYDNVAGGAFAAYTSCYNGSRNYTGEDVVYKFRIDTPSEVTITLQSAAAMGFFLYDFLCGENCLGFAENSTVSDTALLTDLRLAPGFYYLIVDKDSPGGLGNFSLLVECVPYYEPFFVLDTDCTVDSLAQHRVTLQNTRLNNRPIAFGDQIMFFALKDISQPIDDNGFLTQQRLVVWGENVEEVILYKDDESDTYKCSYTPNEEFFIQVKPQATPNNTINVKALYQPPQEPLINSNNNQFTPSGKSVITKFVPNGDPVNLFVGPSEKTFTADGGNFNVIVASNMQWNVVERTDVDWVNITAGQRQGKGARSVEVSINRNNTTAKRQNALLVVAEGSEQRPVVIKQLGCTQTNAIVSSAQTICQGDTVQLTASGGSCVWLPTNQAANQIKVSPDRTTTYTARVTNNGCTDVKSVVVNVIPRPQPPVSEGDQTGCLGAGITPELSVTAGLGQVVNWYDSPSGGNLVASNTPTFRPTRAGTYFAEAVANNGSTCSSTMRTPVRLNLLPTPTVAINAKTVVCAGERVQLNAIVTGGSGNYAYDWNENLPDIANPTDEPLTNKIYRVTVQDRNGGCPASQEISITVRPRPTLNLLDNVCAANLQTYTIRIAANVSNLRASHGTLLNNNDGTFTISAIPRSQNVSLIARDNASGCEEVLTINAPNCGCPAVAAPVSAGDKEYCANASIPTLNVTVNANQTVDWYDINGNLLQSNSASYLPAQPGTYYAEARISTSGCQSLSRTPVRLIRNELPTIVAVGPSRNPCSGASVNLIASATGGAGGYMFTWSHTADESPNQTVAPLVSTTYIVNVQDAKACRASDTLEITVKPNPVIELGENRTLCAGDSTILRLSARGGSGFYGYNWNNSIGFGGTTQIVSPDTTTVYRVTVTDSERCSATDEVLVQVVPGVEAFVLGVNHVRCFGENTGAATVVVAQAELPYRYAWSDGISRPNTNGLAAGNYQITITDKNNCKASVQFTINQPPAITITNAIIQNETANIGRGTISISAMGGTAPYNYNWTGNGQPLGNSFNTPTLQNVPAGDYRVEITDANGCSITSNTFRVGTTTAIHQAELAKRVSIFPNPTTGRVTLQIDLTTGQAISFEVYDLLGRQLWSKAVLGGKQLQELDLSSYGNGVYFIKVNIGNSYTVKKVIVQN